MGLTMILQGERIGLTFDAKQRREEPTMLHRRKATKNSKLFRLKSVVPEYELGELSKMGH